MLAKPINSTVKKHFQTLFENANAEAKKDFSTNIESRLKNLDHFNQLKLITDELTELKEIIEKSEYPYYIRNHSSEEWLLNQFASRTFLLNVNESDQLYECIRIGAYRSLIFDVENRLKNMIPLYSYSDFLNGIIDPYFQNFDYLYNISEEDYYKIRDWQAEKLTKIVSFESRLFIKQIQNYCKTLPNPLEFILSEKEKIESRLEKANPDSKEIKSILSELFIFQNNDINVFDNDILFENFKIYKSEQINWKYIVPAFINPILEKIEVNDDTIFSNESTLFFSINKVAYWFDLVLKGQPIQQPVKETNWDKLFNKIKKDAETKVESLYQEINDYVYAPGISEDKIKNYLFDKLENYRHKFNEVENKYYFACLTDEKKDLLKRTFITNSFFDNDIKEHSDRIIEAIIINEISWEIVGCYGALFNTRKMDFPENNGSHVEIMFLMHQMVLNKELDAELNKCMQDFFKHFHSYCLPIEIHFQNHRVSMANLFQKSLNRLQTILDDSEPSNKILYLHSRIKQLKQRELDFKQFEHEDFSDKNELRYSNLFKEFLEIEADFINEIKEVQIFPTLLSNGKHKQLNQPSFISSDNSSDIPQPIKVIPVAYMYKKYSSNISAITELLDSLKKHKFVASDTDLIDFRKIFNNTKPKQPILWTGNISELFYFVKLLSNDFNFIEDLKKDKWKVTGQLFNDKNNNPFDWKKFRGQKTPAKADLLESAVDHLK